MELQFVASAEIRLDEDQSIFGNKTAIIYTVHKKYCL